MSCSYAFCQAYRAGMGYRQQRSRLLSFFEKPMKLLSCRWIEGSRGMARGYVGQREIDPRPKYARILPRCTASQHLLFFNHQHAYCPVSLFQRKCVAQTLNTAANHNHVRLSKSALSDGWEVQRRIGSRGEIIPPGDRLLSLRTER